MYKYNRAEDEGGEYITLHSLFDFFFSFPVGRQNPQHNGSAWWLLHVLQSCHGCDWHLWRMVSLCRFLLSLHKPPSGYLGICVRNICSNDTVHSHSVQTPHLGDLVHARKLDSDTSAWSSWAPCWSWSIWGVCRHCHLQS